MKRTYLIGLALVAMFALSAAAAGTASALPTRLSRCARLEPEFEKEGSYKERGNEVCKGEKVASSGPYIWVFTNGVQLPAPDQRSECAQVESPETANAGDFSDPSCTKFVGESNGPYVKVYEGPEYGRCVKSAAKTGEFSDKNCTKEVEPEKEEFGTKKGAYEWVPGPGPKPGYTSKTKAAVLNTPGVGKVTCKKSTDKGTITGLESDVDTVTFTSCETLGKKCTSAGEAAGTIKTFTLKSELGWINQAKGEVGVSLTGEGPGGLSAEFKCEELTIRTKGSVIGRQTVDINAMESKATVTFTEVGEKQVPEKFEFEPKDTLETEVVGLTPFLPSTESAVASEKFEEKSEVKATF